MKNLRTAIDLFFILTVVVIFVFGLMVSVFPCIFWAGVQGVDSRAPGAVQSALPPPDIAGPGVRNPSDAQESSTAPATLPPPAISPVPVAVRPANPSADAPQGPTLRFMRVSAYCPCKICCGRFADGITANGTKADHPLVAAPKSFAFGTRLRIPGYNGGDWVMVEDRGGAIQGNRLDVLFYDPRFSLDYAHRQALQWGVRWLWVEVELLQGAPHAAETAPETDKEPM